MPEDNDVRKSSSERVLSTQQSNAFRGANQVRAQRIMWILVSLSLLISPATT